MNIDVKIKEYKKIREEYFCYIKGGSIMKLDVKINEETKFSNLKKGDTFSFQGNMWMKLEHIVRDTEDNYCANAVSLEFGSVAKFGDDEKVIFAETKLVNA